MTFAQIKSSIIQWFSNVVGQKYTIEDNPAAINTLVSATITGELSEQTLAEVKDFLTSDELTEDDPDIIFEEEDGYITVDGDLCYCAVCEKLSYDRPLDQAFSYEDGVLTLAIGFKIQYILNEDEEIDMERYIHICNAISSEDGFCDDDDEDDYDEDNEDDFDDDFDHLLPGMHHIGGGVWCDDDGDNWDFF